MIEQGSGTEGSTLDQGVLLSKRTLAAVSFAIERVAERLDAETILVSTFQRGPYFKPMLGTYNNLETQGVRCVTAYVGERLEGQTSAHVVLIEDDPLVLVWEAVLISDQMCAYMVARDLEELADGAALLEHGRLFRAEIGFDPVRAVELARDVYTDGRADLDPALLDHLDRVCAAAIGAPLTPAAEALSHGLLLLARQLEWTVARLRSESVTAVSDELTGLWNREGLRRWEGSQDAMLPIPPVGVVLIDLDGFKEINDTLGHLAGDDALRRTAVAIREAVRPQDLVVRWGGDEFLVLCPGVSELHELDRVAARVLAAVGSVHLEDRSMAATAGTQICRHRPLDLASADQAMYANKRSKRAEHDVPPGSGGMSVTDPGRR